jgi:regulation of enolase protein 1 (concanavalin A-like superfamily)
MFEDPFKSKLSNGWSWVREDPKAWRIDDDGLHVRALPGTLWLAANSAKNVLLRAVPDANGFTLEATVANAPAQGGEQAGLIAYRDDDNYVKLVKEFLDGKQWIVLAREEGAKGAPVAKIPVDGKAPARLRLEITATEAIASAQADAGDAGEWKPIGKCPLAGEASSPLKVGLVAHGGSQDADRWATFRDFRIATSARPTP